MSERRWAINPLRGKDQKFGAVVIGRNEGDRLKRCFASLSVADSIVYVDLGSTDGSAEWAEQQGVDVVKLGPPFTAGRARNAGFERLRQKHFFPAYIQFVDGDCEINDSWPQSALSFLSSHPKAGAVFGRLREKHPEHSIYNWLCDCEWNVPTGQARACGGIAMMRCSAFDRVRGFRSDMIAGEEPELCVRLRREGWEIWRIDSEMAFHDVEMKHFIQWWRRSVRSGHAFALGAYLHGRSPERHMVWECRRAWIWGVVLPLACLLAGLVAGPWGWSFFLIYPLQIFRQASRNPGSLKQRIYLSTFQLLSRFAEMLGQVRFWRDRILNNPSTLIEYK